MNQRLFVIFIDGYGTKTPVCWKVYTKPEIEPIIIDSERDFYSPSNFRVRINTFSSVRDIGVKLSRQEAVELFPWLKELPYDI